MRIYPCFGYKVIFGSYSHTDVILDRLTKMKTFHNYKKKRKEREKKIKLCLDLANQIRKYALATEKFIHGIKRFTI